MGRVVPASRNVHEAFPIERPEASYRKVQIYTYCNRA